MEKAIPEKYQKSAFDPYAEVLDLLSDPQTLGIQLQRLQQLSSSIDTIAGQNVEQNQNEISEYLGNLRESEEIMIDYLAYIQDIRNELKGCKRILQEKQTNIKATWLNGIYYAAMTKGYEEIDEILDNLNSVDMLIKEKMYMKAANVIKDSVKAIDSADYNYLSVCQRVKEAFTKKLRKLSDQILEELKCFLLLKHSSFGIELKKYSVVGILNISYLLNDDEEKEQIDSPTSISGLVDALASIDQINRIEHLNMWDIQSDIQELYKKCFAQFPTIPFEEDQKADYRLSSIIVDKPSRETALKIINSVVAVAALVIRNHFILKQSLIQYKYAFQMGGIWEKIQKEIIDVFRTIVKIPEQVRESMAVDILNIDEKDSTYTSLLSSILELSSYHFPYLYHPITTYLAQFHSVIQEGSLVSWVEDFTLQFLEILKNDGCKMFSACVTSNDAFRITKSSESQFLCCSTLLSNLNCLIELKALLNEKYLFHIIEISVNMMNLFFKELNAIIEKQTKDSKFYGLILEDNEIFQEIRMEKSYESVKLKIPEGIYDGFVKALGYLEEKKGKLEDTENSFLKFNAVGNSFIGESAKLNFFALTVNNIELIYSSILNLIGDVIEVIFDDSEDMKQDDRIEKGPDEPSAFRKFTKKIKAGLKRQRRLSHRFYIETRFSSDTVRASDIEINTMLKIHLTQFHQCHDTCLFLLRGEIRMRIYSFLSNIKNQNYWDGEEHTDAEWFIGHLSRELLLVQLALKGVLPNNKLAFVWENSVEIIVEMLITGLGEIKDLSMSKHGLATYIKNVKVLQSELVHIEIPGVVERDLLTKAIDFLDLLQHNEKNLIKYAKQNPKAIPLNYWRILMLIKTPARPYGVMPNSQKIIYDLIKSSNS